MILLWFMEGRRLIPTRRLNTRDMSQEWDWPLEPAFSWEQLGVEAGVGIVAGIMVAISTSTTATTTIETSITTISIAVMATVTANGAIMLSTAGQRRMATGRQQTVLEPGQDNVREVPEEQAVQAVPEA